MLRLRGRTSLGATFVTVLADYAKRLDAVGGRLYLSGIDDSLMELLQRTGQIGPDAPIEAYPATPIVGGATHTAEDAATSWLVSHNQDE